jgi:hypothetical protein
MLSLSGEILKMLYIYIECLLWCLVSEEILLMLFRNNSVVIPFPGEYCYCYITRSTAVLSHFPGIFFLCYNYFLCTSTSAVSSF